MKKKLLSILNSYHKLPYKISKILKIDLDNFVNREMQINCEVAEKFTNKYVTYRLRPKRELEIPIINIAQNSNKTAIVLQGPLMLVDDFTFESALFYKRCYPDAIIIVSTWDDADKIVVKNLEREGILVVTSQLPVSSGHLNINYQVASTLAGIKKAREVGAKYVCKTRTDQRIYHPNALNYLYSLLNTFPVNNKDFQYEQKERFVTVCMPYGDMFYPYCVSDFLYFGFIDDMEKLFLIPQDNREKGTGGKGMSRKSIAQELIAPEIQLIRSYIDSMGGNSKCTIEAYWQFMRNHIVSINRNEIGLFWPKYENRYSENRHFGYFYQKEKKDAWNCYNFDFVHWLSLYNGIIKYDSKYEKYADYIL